MSDFKSFRDAVAKQQAIIHQHQVFRSAAHPDRIWEGYLAAFPEGTNPQYRERTEHDCSACRSFIRSAGSMVAIVDGKLVSVWDVQVGGMYQVVADALSAMVKLAGIDTIWLHDQPSVGIDHNHEHAADGSVVTWHHFHSQLPKSLYVKDGSIASRCGEARTNYQVLERSLREITPESIDIVLELISQNTLYRGEEHKRTLTTLKQVQKDYTKAADKTLFLWSKSLELKQAGGFRNTVIGTLLVDISDDVDLDIAVRKFTDKVAPHNYKRPTAIVTKAMVVKAQQKVEELGLGDSLQRRYAALDDITINNVLFADRSIKPQLGGDELWGDLVKSVAIKVPNLDTVAEVTLEKFINDILPKATSIEVLFENKHAANLVSLIAPANADAPNILKWGNNFSWSYAGDVTDSIKERVKNAGGNVTGDVRCSLSWFNYDDLDLSVKEPGGYTIYFSNRHQTSPAGGRLDVDMNAGGGTSRVPVENITYNSISTMKEGDYDVVVHNFSKRESVDVGFVMEMEVLGDVFQIEHPQAVRDGQRITVATFNYSKANGIQMKGSVKSTPLVQEHWGVKTGTFQKVNAIMFSPNHWDGEETGNKHVFFMMAGCVNPEQSRGLYNEFLRGDLNEHRKVFEMLGSKMKTPVSETQLSGLGFSTTQKSHVVCRVSGSFNRMVKVVF